MHDPPFGYITQATTSGPQLLSSHGLFFLVIFQVPIHCQCEDYGENKRAQMNLDPLYSSRELQEIDGRPKT
jgi:hypothetical protein